MSEQTTRITQFFKKTSEPHDDADAIPPPPPWRRFAEKQTDGRGATFHATDEMVELVNAALVLRRPLLVTGKPGTGKSSLAFAVARQLGLGEVLHWYITSRSTLQHGLYSYDAIARLQDTSLAISRRKAEAEASGAPVMQLPAGDARMQLEESLNIGRYIRLGPLGTAMLPGVDAKSGENNHRPRVLLIDEIDKSDIDLPNDLLNIFEEGRFEIPELVRLPDEERFRRIAVLPCDGETPVFVERGRIHCTTFPFVILTSNDEREFPPAFLRRCLRLDVGLPNDEELRDIVTDHLTGSGAVQAEVGTLRDEFLKRRDNQKQELATDQLLNAVYLVMHGLDATQRKLLKEALFRTLSAR